MRYDNVLLKCKVCIKDDRINEQLYKYNKDNLDMLRMK